MKQYGRFYHYVKGNANNESMCSCIFVDTETDIVHLDKVTDGHKLRFGWAAHARRQKHGAWSEPSWCRFTDASEFWTWALSKTLAKVKTWVWCHNSSFDYPVLNAFCYLPDHGWTLQSAIIDAPPTLVKYSSGNKTLMLADTLNIWRMSLVELGKRVGIEKLEMPEKWADTVEDDEYCKRDVLIILKAITGWTDFVRDKDMGGFQPTIAGQAMRTFRHKFMHDKILIDANPLALALARACYHGGRCEAHFIGKIKGPVHSLDVNSMYPFVMSYAQMPVRLKGLSHHIQVHHLPRLLNEYCICAKVLLETDEPFAPLRHDGKLCFPIGRFEAWLTTPEIEYACQRGMIKEIYQAAFYERAVAFRDFALTLYSYKESASRDGNEIEARHWKLILNSFYGKWGQNGRKWEKIGTCDPKLFEFMPFIDAQTLKVTYQRKFGGIIFERREEAESRESHPAIAAHICAHARMVLWAIIRQVSPEDYFYCDTDGLLVSENGLNALRDRLDQHQLGGLKHVTSYAEVTIKGCKDMLLEDKQVLKGIRKGAQDLGQGRYRQLKWSSLKGLIRAKSLNMPLTTSIDKLLSRTYTKGVVGADGFVTPLHLPLLEG